MAHYICICGTDHPTEEGRIICGMEHGKVHPLYVPTSPCDAKECPTQAHRLAVCFEEHCPHAWQREAKEKREKDQKEVADG